MTQSFGSLDLIELSEDDLQAIQGGGWFKKLTGISTPKPLKRFDDWARDNNFYEIVAVGAVIASGGSCLVQPGKIVCAF